MANNASHVLSGKPLPTGGILYAPVGTALPTSETTALNPAFTPAGYASKDGFGLKPDRSTSKVKAWGGDIVMATQDEFDVTATLTLIETLGGDSNKIAFGSKNVTTTPATVSTGLKVTTKINSLELDHWSWVIEAKQGVKRVRLVIPNGQPTAIDEVKWVDDDAEGYAITLTLSPDAAGNYAYRYSDDGVLSA